MKNVKILLAALLFCSFIAPEGSPIKITLPLVLAFIVGVYEVIIRLVPTFGQWGIIGKLIDILKWLSDFLNRTKSPTHN
jgi:hypothetical protein